MVEKKYLQKVRDDPVGGFTGLLFVATLLLAHIAARQIKDSRAIQRANVFVLSPGYRFNFDNHGTIVGLRLWVILENSGTTPASNRRPTRRHPSRHFRHEGNLLVLLSTG